MRITAALSLSLLLSSLWGCAATAPRGEGVVLVTEEEAALPDAPPEAPRGVCVEPGIDIRSPAEGRSYRAPLPVEVRFTPSAGARIDLSRIRVKLLKGPFGVNITDRARPFLTEQGVSMPQAKFPRGTYHVEVTVADTAGKSCSTTVQFSVT